MSNNGHAGESIRTALARYESPLTRYAQRITGDAERARDVVQETFLRLCRDDVPPDGRLAVWLFTVCRNQALDVRRKESRMTTLAEIQPTNTHREPPPERMAEDRDEAERVRKGIENLPEKQQQVILLKFRDGLSYREISERTNLSISNVGYLIHQAIKTLRVRLRPT